MMFGITFAVPGLPIAQPRQRHRVVTDRSGRTFASNYTPARHPVNVFKAAVQYGFHNQCLSEELQADLRQRPVSVRLLCRFPRPKRLCTAKRATEAIQHTSRPDCENIAKSVLDALTGMAWRDDSQVWELRVEKWYALPGVAAGCDVGIYWGDSHD